MGANGVGQTSIFPVEPFLEFAIRLVEDFVVMNRAFVGYASDKTQLDRRISGQRLNLM